MKKIIIIIIFFIFFFILVTQLDNLISFVENTTVDFAFGLNVGPGSRIQTNYTQYNATNSIQVMEYITKKLNHTNTEIIFEFSNEVKNNYLLLFKIYNYHYYYYLAQFLLFSIWS